MEKIKILYVDDIRFPTIWHDAGCEITVARTYKEAIELLNYGFDIIDLDHDLGEVYTGYDICKYIINNDIKIPKIYIHTSNPVGRDNMISILKRYTKSKVEFYDFKYLI